MTDLDEGHFEEEVAQEVVQEAATSARTDEGERTGAKAVRRRTFLFETARLMMSHAMHVSVMVAVGIVTMRVWGKEVRGEIQAAIVVPGILSILFDMGLSRALPYMIGQRKRSVEKVTGAAISLFLVTTVASLAILVGYYMSPAMMDLPVWWLFLAGMTLPLRLFMALTNGFAVGIERVGYLSRILWLRTPILLSVVLIGGVVLGMSRPEDGWIRLLAPVVAFSVAVGYGVILILRHTRIRLSWDWGLILETLRRSFVFGIGPLFMQLAQQLPAMLITLTFFAETVSKGDIGEFGVGSAIALLLLQIAYAVGHVLMSRSVNAPNHREQALKTARLVRVGLAGAVPGAVVLWVTAPYFVPLVYGSDVRQAARVTQYMLPGIVAFFALHTFAVDLTGKGRAWLVAMVTGPMLLATVLVNVLYAIPRHGIFGAAITTSAIYVGSALVMLVIYSRATGVSVYQICRPHRDDLQVWHAVRRKLPRFLRGRG